MTLLKRGPYYVLECTYADRQVAKDSGFWFHAGPGRCTRRPCAECEAGLGLCWWTAKADIAVQLVSVADEECRAALAPAEKAVESSRADDSEIQIPKPPGLADEFKGYQKAGVAYALERRYTLFGDEMGLGKTIQALGVINCLPDVMRVLVLAPATLRINWFREARKWLVRPFNFCVIDRTMEVPSWASFVVVNYDKLLSEPVLNSLLRYQWDVLIADEMHKCKNPKAKRTRAVYGTPCEDCKGTGRTHHPVEHRKWVVCATCEGRCLSAPGLIEKAAIGLFLTGTPILNRPGELFTFLHATYPTEFPNWYAFRKRFCAGFDDGASNLEQLQARLRGLCMVRRQKADVLKELPPKTRSIVLLEKADFEDVLEAERKALANVKDAQEALDAMQAAKEAAEENPEAYQIAVSKLSDIRIPFEEISLVRHATAFAKVPAVKERIDEILESVPKLVVWAHHRDVLAQIAEPYGSEAVLVHGETKFDDRQKAVDRFQADPKCRLFVASITAAGVGITLTAASYELFAELDWVPANITQAEDRCHRIGQHDNVTVEHLVIDESIDAKMAKTIVAKQEIADRALDRKADVKLDQAPKPVDRDDEQTSAIRSATPGQREAVKKWAEAQAPRSAGYDNLETFDEAHRAAALKAMQIVAGVCDGAHQRDGSGFSKFDQDFGHRLASCEGLSHKQTFYAVRLARKYRRQLVATGLLETLGIEIEKPKAKRVARQAEAVA